MKNGLNTATLKLAESAISRISLTSAMSSLASADFELWKHFTAFGHWSPANLNLILKNFAETFFSKVSSQHCLSKYYKNQYRTIQWSSRLYQYCFYLEEKPRRQNGAFVSRKDEVVDEWCGCSVLKNIVEPNNLLSGKFRVKITKTWV